MLKKQHSAIPITGYDRLLTTVCGAMALSMSALVGTSLSFLIQDFFTAGAMAYTVLLGTANLLNAIIFVWFLRFTAQGLSGHQLVLKKYAENIDDVALMMRKRGYILSYLMVYIGLAIVFISNRFFIDQFGWVQLLATVLGGFFLMLFAIVATSIFKQWPPSKLDAVMCSSITLFLFSPLFVGLAFVFSYGVYSIFQSMASISASALIAILAGITAIRFFLTRSTSSTRRKHFD